MPERIHSEFDLHIWKSVGDHGRPDLYTIGVWQGMEIKSLCHIAQLEDALGILREALKKAGCSVSTAQR